MRSQSALEFMQSFTFLLVMITVFSGIFLSYYVKVNQELRQAELADFTQELGMVLNKAFLAGHGTRFYYTVPQQVGGFNYSINLNSSARILEVYSGEHLYSVKLLGEVRVIEWKENSTIENVDGVVYVK